MIWNTKELAQLLDAVTGVGTKFAERVHTVRPDLRATEDMIDDLEPTGREFLRRYLQERGLSEGLVDESYVAFRLGLTLRLKQLTNSPAPPGGSA